MQGSYARIWIYHVYCMKMCLHMFTFRIGIGISFEQACQDPHGIENYFKASPTTPNNVHAMDKVGTNVSV